MPNNIRQLRQTHYSNQRSSVQKTNICCWFSIPRLCEILEISESTARRYQSGKTNPRKGEIKLLELMHDGKIMPATWPAGMKFRGELLTTPNENESLTWKEIDTYRWVMGQWHWSNQNLIKLERKLASQN
ncbi:MAG: hypothetical protein AAGM67_01390 [Bacteroidota bacterium]